METQYVSYKLKDIELIEFNITPIDYVLNNLNTIFKFDINIEYSDNLKDSLIDIKSSIKISADESETILGTLTARLAFEFENLSTFVIEKKIKLPPDIIIELNSSVISTVRGIMFSTFKGTYLHNAFLPVIDTKEMTKT